MRLLAKAPDDRYQRAHGLAEDLSICLQRLDGDGHIAAFELGQRDLAEALRIPQQLYGREREVQALMDAFTRVQTGRPELLLLAGGAGVGKSMLVHEVHKAIARNGGRFVTGKFDLLNRDAPFSALARAFDDLVRQLLTEPSTNLAQWRSMLQMALGANGQLMVDLVPALERLIGPQAPLQTLRPTEARNRFELVFQNFVRVFCTATTPLVLFLDDLQWADPATLSLLHLLLADPAGGHLLVVGAYRDTEVEAAHPLRAMIQQLGHQRVATTELTLGPLDRASVRELLAASLMRARADESLDVLTGLVFDKTHGNPFFLTQLLVVLHKSGLLRLDTESGAWTWDAAAIASAPIADNVVEFMSAQLRLLDPRTQWLLSVGACIGHEFDLSTLAAVADVSLGQIVAELWPALRAGLVLPLDSSYRLLIAHDEHSGAELHELADLTVLCRFQHDRVQQAALSLSDEQSRQDVHLRIGRRLEARAGGELRGDALFAVVRHLNAAAPKITDPAQRLALAQLNLEAARAAKKATATAAATGFLEVAIALLPADSWDTLYDLTFALHRERAECDYLSGRADLAEAQFDDLLLRARSNLVKAELHSLRMVLLTSQGRFGESLAVGRTGLALFGDTLPEGPEAIMATFGATLAAIEAELQQRPVDTLADAPALTDPVQRAVLRLLNEAFGSAFLVDARLGSVVTLKQVLLSLRYGHSELSAFGYASHGYILAGPLGRPFDAQRFGQLALQVIERFPSAEVVSRVHFMVGFYFGLTQPLRTTITHFTLALQLGLDAGELVFSSQAAVFVAMTQLRLGDDLAVVRESIARAEGVLQRTHDVLATAMLMPQQQIVETLRHRTWWGGALETDTDEERAWLAGVDASGMVVVRCLHQISKLIVLTLFEEYARARDVIAAVEPILFNAVGAPYTADFPYYAALTLAALYPSLPEDERAAGLAAIERHRDAIAVLAAHCPENEQHRLLLVEAELARVGGQELTAMDAYERAIDAAHRSGFYHHEALANELCAKFHIASGRTRVAHVYLSQARFLYDRWGAVAKVVDVESRHPYLVMHSEVGTGSSSTTGRAFVTSSLSNALNQGLDLASVLKASQAFAAEIELQPLLEKIIQIMVENAGARRGVLLLTQEGQLNIVAESSAETGPYTLAQPEPLKDSRMLPSSIVYYVAHASDSVILDDAARTGPFTSDSYVAERSTRSVLCTPLVYQTQLIGVLYLENDLTPSVFPEGRLKAIKLIASQAAIAIENANLYANMERLVHKRTDELSRVNESLTASNAELDAFARTVAHDLKNPLGAVTGYSEYLLENLREIEAEEAEKVVENIRRASQTATSIIDELLLLAGVRKQQVQATRLDMAAIVKQVEQRMAYMLDEHDGEIRRPDTWPAAMGYAPWIEEAWTNYISNGLKYGGVPPRLELGADVLDDGRVRFWVQDNGAGISEADRSRLFAEFTRLDEVRAEGHGLGLSIVRRIIERLDGQVGVESRSEGSRFFFTLPAADAAASAVVPEA
ncbi:MAG TPA: AAA family ATPase [Nannocystis sp.]